jgi:hypothetical protein
VNDIEILNNCIRVEKAVHSRTKLQLDQREKELEDLRREALDKEADLRLKINELSTKVADRDR